VYPAPPSIGWPAVIVLVGINGVEVTEGTTGGFAAPGKTPPTNPSQDLDGS
jgi:hypothetical protein